MIRFKDDIKSESIEHKFGGDGFITVDSLNECDEELNNKGRVLAHTTIGPGCSIGYHEHHGESEIYFIMKGDGEFNDNGNIVPSMLVMLHIHFQEWDMESGIQAIFRWKWLL